MQLALKAIGNGPRRIGPDLFDAPFDVCKIGQVLDLFGVQRNACPRGTLLVRRAQLGIFFKVLAAEKRDPS
jgi:hypothetical protein